MPDFPRKERLRRKKDFSVIFKRNRRVHGDNMSLLVGKSEQSGRRVAFIVSRKIGNSVKRNRVKRLLRESYRSHKHLLDDKIEIIFIAKPKIVQANHSIIQNEVLKLFRCL